MKQASSLIGWVVTLSVVVSISIHALAASPFSPDPEISIVSPGVTAASAVGTDGRINANFDPPCLVDLLSLDDVVLCHPASPFMEVRFNLWDTPVSGTNIFEVFAGEVWIGNVWMAYTGTLLVLKSHAGATITVSQFGTDGCSREFVLPGCSENVCPLGEVRESKAMDCEGVMAHYQLNLRHDSPINIPSTDFAVYDEAGEFITIMSVWEGDSTFNLFVPMSPVDRQYSLCDIFQYPECCIEFTVPAVSCDSLAVKTVNLPMPDMRLYPNPLTDLLLIDVAGDGSYDYRIVSATGGMVASGIIDRRPMRVDMSSLPAGVYMVGLWQGDAPLGYRRVVKVW